MRGATSVVLLATNLENTEIGLQECKQLNKRVVLVDLTLPSTPHLPNGISLVYVRPSQKERSSVTAAINKGITSCEENVFLVADYNIDLLVNLPILETAQKNVPKLAGIHADKNTIPGTRQVQWIPLFGSLYTRMALNQIGLFDTTIKDVKTAAHEWSIRAGRRGWSSVLTLGINDRLTQESFTEESKIPEPPEIFSLIEDQRHDERDQALLTPDRNLGSLKPWTGPTQNKPWSYKITVSISNFGANPRAIRLIADLWRSQTRKPFLEIRDTGTPTKFLPDLLAIEDSDLEVHLSRWRGHREHYELQTLAIEHALTDCRSPYLVLTHNDLFPTNQTVLEELISQCDQNQPVVGYEMSPRGDGKHKGMIGTTLTCIHVDSMDRIRATWNPRWLRNCKPGQARQSNGWPTENTTFNTVLKAAGIEPKIIGQGKSGERHITTHFDHVTHYTTSLLYDRAYSSKAEADMQDAITAAEIRLAKWREG